MDLRGDPNSCSLGVYTVPTQLTLCELAEAQVVHALMD